jgi:hypothetical protein
MRYLAKILWQFCGSLFSGRDCHRIATETLGIFEKFTFCRGNKKTCKSKNLQVLKAFQKILVVFANFEKFVSTVSVESPGIEPGSKQGSEELSTRLVSA